MLLRRPTLKYPKTIDLTILRLSFGFTYIAEGLTLDTSVIRWLRRIGNFPDPQRFDGVNIARSLS